MTNLNAFIHDATIWLLIGFSVVTWSLIVIKAIQSFRINQQNRQFVQEFWAAKNLPQAAQFSQQANGANARIAQSGFNTLKEADDKTHEDLQHSWSRQDLVERHLRKQIHAERRSLEAGLAVLASIGNTAPFVGLFGTVFGIIHALGAIAASGNASMDVVAGPIVEALIATGIGIAVAVPAVLAYNFFIRRVKATGADLDDFATDFLSLVQKAGFRVTTPVTNPVNASIKVTDNSKAVNTDNENKNENKKEVFA